MSNNKPRLFLYFSAFVILFLILLISTISYPSTVSSEIPYIFSMHAGAEAFVLFIVLRILRKLSMLASWGLIIYHAIIVGGSFFVNFLTSPIEVANIGILALSVFILFVFLNVALSKIIFDVNFRRACLLGTIMGLINAIVVIVATPVYQTHNSTE